MGCGPSKEAKVDSKPKSNGKPETIKPAVGTVSYAKVDEHARKVRHSQSVRFGFSYSLHYDRNTIVCLKWYF